MPEIDVPPHRLSSPAAKRPATKKLTLINIRASVLRSDADDDQERAMPATATTEIRKPTADTDLLGQLQVEPQPPEEFRR
jgi:hypothetical protein